MKLTANLLARTLAQVINSTKEQDLDKVLNNFSKFLTKNSWSSESKIKKIFSAYKLVQSVYGGKQAVTITTARKLSNEETKRIAKIAEKICGTHVEADNQINENLIGGLVLEGFDWRYSADVKSDLVKLRANLVNS